MTTNQDIFTSKASVREGIETEVEQNNMQRYCELYEMYAWGTPYAVRGR
jgi:hypothetical protein